MGTAVIPRGAELVEPGAAHQPIDPVIKTLDDAADWLEANEWMRGDWRAESMGKQYACAVGSVRAVTTERASIWDVIEADRLCVAVVDFLDFEVREEGLSHTVVGFNDNLATSKEDVVGLFRRTAEKLRCTAEKLR